MKNNCKVSPETMIAYQGRPLLSALFSRPIFSSQTSGELNIKSRNPQEKPTQSIKQARQTKEHSVFRFCIIALGMSQRRMKFE
jgi:hypothetical protein